METTGEELAQRFDQLNREFGEELRMLPEAAWTNSKTEEGWTVGQAAHHVAGWYPWMAEAVDNLAKGKPLPSMDRPLDERNAQHAEADMGRSGQEAIALAESGGWRITELLRGLNAAQLAHKTPSGNGAEMTLAELAENMVIGHVRMHLAHIRAAVPAGRG